MHFKLMQLSVFLESLNPYNLKFYKKRNLKFAFTKYFNEFKINVISKKNNFRAAIFAIEIDDNFLMGCYFIYTCKKSYFNIFPKI